MKIRCKNCGAQLQVGDEHRGRRIRCPRCEHQILVKRRRSQTHKLQTNDPIADAVEQTAARSAERAKSSANNDDFQVISFVNQPSKKPKKPKTRWIKRRSTSNSDSRPVRRSARYSAWSMLAGVADRPFWRGALAHLPFMTGSILCAAAILGSFMGVIRSIGAANMVFTYMGILTMLATFIVFSYPGACFLKVIIGSAAGEDDIGEWPDGGFSDWVFETAFVAYLVVMSLMASTGIATLRQTISPERFPNRTYWRLIGTARDINELAIVPKVLGNNGPRLVIDLGTGHDVFNPGAGWWTTLMGFAVIFPLIGISCLDSRSPTLVPWSSQVWFSLWRCPRAWIVAGLVFAAIQYVAAIIFVIGAATYPVWVFSLCSPVVAITLLVYARLLGRLSWQVGQA